MYAFTTWLRRIGKARPARFGRDRGLELSDTAARWLSQLPSEVQPVQLCRCFPGIADRIAASWQDEALTECAISQLLSDTGGDRQELPPEVFEELAALYGWLHLSRMNRSGEVESWQPPALG